MSSDPDNPSPDLPTTTIARRVLSQNGAPAVTIILEGQANDWVTIECLNRLSSRFDRIPDQREPSGKYVGVHAITLMPVFTTGSTFILRPGGRQAAAKDIIFDEKLLRNTSTESAAALKSTEVVIDEGFVPAQKRRQRFPARPGPAKRSRLDDVGPEAHHMELPLRLGHIDEYRQTEFFRLAVPCLGNIQIPETLVALARAIQASLHKDNLHLHVVVMAIIVWVDIHADPAERGRVRFPPQNLAQFVAYWPHFLRFHEVFHLPVYCHPCQFTQVMGQNNIYAAREDWEEEAKTLVDICRLHPRTDYAQMLPSSWPGSTLTFPADAEDYGFATPSMNLAKKLGQPSIHIIGHPAYPCDGLRDTALLLPRTWMSPAIKHATPRTATEISDIVIEPERRELGSLRLITGQVLDIFPRPEDLDPLATIPAQQSPARPPRPVMQQQEVHTNVHTNDSVGVFWEHVASPEFRRAQKEAQESKLQDAIAAGITLNQVSFDQNNLLSWPALNQVARPPAPLLSAELAAEVRVAVNAYLLSPHRHQEFRNFLDLVQSAENLDVGSIRTALKRAVNQTQTLKETMEDFVRNFHARAFVHDDPTDWTFCRAIAPKFLIPLLHLTGADELATQPVQTLTPERVFGAVKGIVDVHKFTLNLLAPGTAVCEPGSRVLIDECIPLTTYWMKSLLKSFPFQMLEIFQKLLDSFPEDD